MTLELYIDEEDVAVLDEYCRLRTTTVRILVGRVARTWCARAAMEWVRNPSLIPDLPSVREKNITAVAPDDATIARDFKKIVGIVAERTGAAIDPCDLLSWLMKMFIKAYKLKFMAKWKPWSGGGRSVRPTIKWR